MTIDESPKARLKVLRDKLAAAVPRARIRPGVPPEVLGRVTAAAKQVADVYLLIASKKDDAGSTDDLVDDALVEGHLILSELERVLAQGGPPELSRPAATIDRRQHERHEVNVTVKLLRHSVRHEHDGGVSLGTETVQRAARNISMSGIWVTLPQGELSQVGVGHVVHVQVGTHAGGPAFQARGVVMRRDASGVGLSWVLDTERVRKDVTMLLDVVRRGASAGSLI